MLLRGSTHRLALLAAALVALIAAALGTWQAFAPSTPPASREQPRREDRPPAARPAPDAGARQGWGSGVGFASRQRWLEHYEKHGEQFGAITAEEYLRRAQALRDAPAGGPILEVVRDDGVITRYDRNSGAFIAVNRNGSIRTFFRPNDGERYFHRQLERGR
jgi:pyocin large subunit-like protein